MLHGYFINRKSKEELWHRWRYYIYRYESSYNHFHILNFTQCILLDYTKIVGFVRSVSMIFKYLFIDCRLLHGQYLVCNQALLHWKTPQHTYPTEMWPTASKFSVWNKLIFEEIRHPSLNTNFTWNPHVSLTWRHKLRSTSVTNKPSDTLDKPWRNTHFCKTFFRKSFLI